MHRKSALPLALLALATLPACTISSGRAGPEVIAPAAARVGDLPFSPATRAGDFIFLSGAIGTRPGTTELVSSEVGAQTRQTMENLRTVLRAARSDLDDVVKCTVFLVDMRDYAAMNAAYASFWEGPPPARSTMAGSGLALGARVEIECIAYDPR
ncbi:MAG TPA: Rid family detoxifying hydrolase [Longimicrobiales bacterium]|nr:Rid family detoxifying hydrolase [Longimicrobiales bacterium]